MLARKKRRRRRLRNPLANTKPITVGLVLLTGLWVAFQLKDPTPPPVLDQVLVAAFGVWFANEAIDKRNSEASKREREHVGERTADRALEGRPKRLPRDVDDDEEDDEDEDDEELDA